MANQACQSREEGIKHLFRLLSETSNFFHTLQLCLNHNTEANRRRSVTGHWSPQSLCNVSERRCFWSPENPKNVAWGQIFHKTTTLKMSMFLYFSMLLCFRQTEFRIWKQLNCWWRFQKQTKRRLYDFMTPRTSDPEPNEARPSVSPGILTRLSI